MTLVTVWLISKERASFIHDTVRSPGEESSSFRNALYIARYMCLKMTGRVFWPSSDVLQHHSYIAPRDKSFSFHEPAWSSNSQHGNLQQRVTGNSDAKKLYTHIAKEKKRKEIYWAVSPYTQLQQSCEESRLSDLDRSRAEKLHFYESGDELPVPHQEIHTTRSSFFWDVT